MLSDSESIDEGSPHVGPAPTARILVVEDNRTIADGIRHSLEHEGFAVDVAYDGEEGLRRLAKGDVDLVILDLMLPRRDGFHVLTDLRGMGCHAPVLILSARAAELDKLRGFRLGADDYVVKPFGLLELFARVAALLRRSRGATPGIHELTPPVRFGDIEVRRGERAVLKAGAPLWLRPREYDLLAALIDRHGEAASREQLLREVWGYDESIVTRTVDSHVAALRHQLESDPTSPQHILTVRKLGYRLKM